VRIILVFCGLFLNSREIPGGGNRRRGGYDDGPDYKIYQVDLYITNFLVIGDFSD